MNDLRREGFHKVIYLHGVEEIDAATIERQPLWNDRAATTGPSTSSATSTAASTSSRAVGRLGYWSVPTAPAPHHPDGRRAFFVGDLVDRGPATPAVLRLAMGMVAAGDALCIPGNHETKLLRALRGRNVTISHGLAETLAQLAERAARVLRPRSRRSSTAS